MDLGTLERARVLATIPLWGFLLISEVERTGVPQHRLDCGVRGAEAQGQN